MIYSLLTIIKKLCQIRITYKKRTLLNTIEQPTFQIVHVEHLYLINLFES